MNGKLFMLAVVLGLVNALPTKNLQTSRKTIATNNGPNPYNGKNTTITHHNYLVAIHNGYGINCAGTIVSESYVLTLGLCARNFEYSYMTVVSGSSDGIAGSIYNVQEVNFPPGYHSTYSYNFALLQINGTFTWAEDVGYATLPSKDPKSGTALVAAGYEYSIYSEEATLLRGITYYVTGENCDVTFDPSMACVYNKNTTAMCWSDFGNPLTHGRVLYGMMADFYSPCHGGVLPIIISDVYAVVDWIKKFI